MRGIVLHFSKSVYWQVPKNACTTIKVHLINLLEIPNNGNPHRAKFEWTETPIEGYTNWALVRNPYSRLYSLWVNKIAPGHPTVDSWPAGIDKNVFGKMGDSILSEMPFENFVFTLLNSGRHNPHWNPQATMIPESCECTRMEQFERPMRVLFPSHNRAHMDTSNWRVAYTPEMQKLVRNYYSEDFRRFGYSPHPVNRLLIDCDGVLTDGCLTIDHCGEKQFKQFHTRDVRAIREFVYHGWEVILVSADDWDGLAHFAAKVGAEPYYCRDKSCLPYSDYIAVGDDAWDVCMMQNAYRGFAPADADQSIADLDNVKVLKTAGGRGVMAEVARELL